MSEAKPKKREMDELYTLLIAALHNMMKQVTEIYDLDFSTVVVHLEQVEHGC